jgi:co-chaperonin GroES (HSP10)
MRWARLHLVARAGSKRHRIVVKVQSWRVRKATRVMTIQIVRGDRLIFEKFDKLRVVEVETFAFAL